MIKIYLQYSYGGFKTFFIEGIENESVIKEVTNNENFGMPSEAHRFFQYGGSKIIYRYLNNGNLDLVIKEIPSVHKDGDGRNISCAVQFIGDLSDRHNLNYLAIDIANGLEKFHDFFSHLFRMRGGLIIEGNKLRKWIEDHNIPFVCDSPVEQLKKVTDIQSGIILFVPLSCNFGIDKVVTENVVNDLKLPLKQMKKDNCIISYNSLIKSQNKTKIITGGVDSNYNSINSSTFYLTDKRNEKFKEETNNEKKLLKVIKNNITERLSYNKRIFYIIVLIAFIIALYSVYSLIINKLCHVN